MKKEEILDNGLVRTYSDAGFKLEQVDTEWLCIEAVDPPGHEHTYRETDIPIPVEPQVANAE